MTTQDQSERVDWRDGAVPVSSLFDDPYFSLQDGLSETRHVFHGGNGLPGRFRGGFVVAELGFGTGLNLLATAIAWQASGVAGRLSFISTHLSWELDASVVREEQVVAVDAFARTRHRDLPTIMVGDFNASPDADSIRFLTGRKSLRSKSTYWRDAFARDSFCGFIGASLPMRFALGASKTQAKWPFCFCTSGNSGT